MSQIKISNLTFGYNNSYDNIFENVSFQIDTDWKLGFIGRNGRGKTTFLKLLMGEYSYQGSIFSSVSFDYFPYVVPDKEQNTIDVIESINNYYEFWELSKELSLLEIAEDTLYRPFSTLSNGEQTKVLLAALFLKDNNFLLIDEPTNHLDINARKLVSKYLQSKKGFILVSHDKEFLDNSIDYILSINKNNIEIQKGNFSSWHRNKENQDNFELAENEKLKKEIKTLESAAKRTAHWSDQVEKSKFGEKVPDRGYIGHKAAKMMKRSKSIENRQQKALTEKAKLLKNIELAENLSIKTSRHPKSKLLELNHLAIFYNEHQVCEDVSFIINQGDRIALNGKNGSGKTSVIKLILGQDIKFTGSLNKASNLRISYVSQDTSYLRGNLRDFAVENHIDESLFKNILRKLDFSRIQFEKDMQDFSEGLKKKVLIAKSLCEQAHLYIWDEPLNFIDVLSRMQIEELILKYRPTMLFVEHDVSFSNAVATKKVSL